MDPERWKRIKEVVQAAVELKAEERPAFLDSECRGDPTLRREVESLIDYQEEASGFLESTAIKDAALLMADAQPSCMEGRTIGHYNLARKIGEGGMGEVYLAHDTSLNRRVAIKFLSGELNTDERARRRLIREARATACLEHANICSVYEASEQDHLTFIVMQYVEGETLAERIARKPLEIEEVLDIAEQVADGLAEAHSHGIIHRDVKPQNVMLTARGQVKVLDFGLAKMGRSQEVAASELATESLMSGPRVIAGTVPYMSPEQLRAEAIDSRCDIFSLGVVMYEMITGRQPFARGSSAETIAAIQMVEPAPLRTYKAEAPEALQSIVKKSLQKEREERYQTARELVLDLRSLKHRLEFEQELERSHPPGVGEGGQHLAIAAANEAADAGLAAVTQPATATAHQGGEIKRRKMAAAVITGATLLVLFALGLGLYRFAGSNQSQPASATKTIASTLNMTRLTGSAKVQNAAVSPDGKYIVYVVKEGARQSLWLRQVAVTSNVQILAPAEVQYVGETFSPDGNLIYYVAIDSNNPAGALYQVPVLGGAPRRILMGISSPVAFSPDGNRIAFLRSEEQTTGEFNLMVADVDGTNERWLAVRKGYEYKWFGNGGPGWSPDGKQIAAPGGSETGDFRWFVIVVDVESGVQTEFSSQRFLNTGRICWLADKSGMVVSATTQQSDFKQIWLISYPGGEARQITRDLNDYNLGLSMTADSKLLVTVQNDITDDIWVGPADNPSQARQITSGRRDGRRGLAWTPDGRIVYPSYLSGNADIWIMNADGTNQKQLTYSPYRDGGPAVSPDGRYVVFWSNRAGGFSLWRMDIDGGNVKPLTSGQEDFSPQFSPDGRWIVFDSTRPDKGTLWKVSIDGGEPVQLTDKLTWSSSISPDGKLIACYYKHQPDSPVKILIMPFEGGDPLGVFDMPTGLGKDDTDMEGPVAWTSDGRAILYLDIQGGTRNLWRQALNSEKPAQLTNYTSNGIRWSSLSNDGRQIALTRETIISDVVLLSDFR